MPDSSPSNKHSNASNVVQFPGTDLEARGEQAARLRTDRDAYEALRHLPFVGFDDDRGLVFWRINPPEGYCGGCEYGAEMADALLRHIASTGTLGSRWLTDIALEQVRLGEPTEGHRGAAVGFWHLIGCAINTCLDHTPVEAIRQRDDAEQAELSDAIRAWLRDPGRT